MIRRTLNVAHVGALTGCVHRTDPPRRAAAQRERPPTPFWRRATGEVWRRRSSHKRSAAARGIRPPASAARVAQAPGEATGLGQLSGLLAAVDGLVCTVGHGDGRWLVQDQPKDQRFGLRFATGIAASKYWLSQTIASSIRPSACSS